MNKKNNSRKIIIVSGPSGAGKSTVVRRIVDTNPSSYELIKSVTTRKCRSDNEYYTFVTEKMFEKMLQTDAFLESNIYQGNDCMYGTPIEPVMRSLEVNKIPILEIDVNGKRQIDNCKDKYGIETVSIFIVASPHVLYQRLLDRGESVEDIIRRLRASYSEVVKGSEYDVFIVNDDLNHTIETVNKVIENDMDKGNDSLKDYISDLEELLSKIDNLDSVGALMKRVEQFCVIRDWDKFNNPKDLAIGVSTEANELLDIFRFKTYEQMEKMMQNPVYREHVGEEIADTMFFLLRFCAKYGFVPGEILLDKIEKNNQKYPVSTVKGRNLKSPEYTIKEQ